MLKPATNFIKPFPSQRIARKTTKSAVFLRNYLALRAILGPTRMAAKARRVFEEVSQLPRKRQLRIVSVVEDMLAAAR